MEEKKTKRAGNVVTGTVGAFLGSLLGVACIVLVGQLGYVASISGLVMAVCAIKGYDLLGGGLDKKGAIISGILVLVMTFFANRLDWAIALAKEADMGIFEAFRALGYLLREGYLEPLPYWGGLAMLYLFTLLGAVPAIIGGLRGNHSSVLPAQPLATDTEGAPARQMTFYPAQKGWMRPLRVSVSLGMFLPLIGAVGLLAVAMVNENQFCWLGAAAGALLATVVALFMALVQMRLCQADNILLVRDGSGTLWQVLINPLNTMDTYRFTSKKSAVRALRWDLLTQEEQERLKTSVTRAIADLTSGQLFPGSALSHLVMPLTELEPVQENSWRWKVSYLTGTGRKTLSISKAYPDLRPFADAEALQGPVPYRWRFLAIVAAVAVAIAAVGFALGLSVDGGWEIPKVKGQTTSRPAAGTDDHVTASVPDDTVTHTLDGISYAVDSAYTEEGDDAYYDGALKTTFSVSVLHGMDESTALERLIQPISDHRMDTEFETFQFDYVSDDWGALTTQSGDDYQYNILTVYFKDGRTMHTGVIYSEDGTLLAVDADHDRRKDEEAVKSALRGILESAEVTGSVPGTPLTAEITAENYQTFFQPAQSMGYAQVGLAYYKAPADMFGREAFLDAYLPYGEDLVYSEDGLSVQSTAHGMRVRQTTAYSEESAEAVVDAAYEAMAASGLDLYEEGISETQYASEYDIAYKQVVYFEEDRTKARVAILYADVKQEGYYLSAQITYLPEQMDGDYPALLTELGDAFALDLPDFSPSDS